MSVRRLAAEQPEAFGFTPGNLRWAKAQLKKYPEGRQASAVIPLLWRAQEQCGGWLPEPALRYVADMLGLAYIRIYEIATFYTMFNLAPVGRYFVQVCGTTPCWLRGADEIKATCRKLIGEPGHVTKDGLFSWTEVECLGACVNAPMVQINKDYYEDLTPASLERVLTDLREGREVKPGPQDGRHSSEPFSGPKTLASAEPA
jgi:NADH-quinone oxidoreductase subunit E